MTLISDLVNSWRQFFQDIVILLYLFYNFDLEGQGYIFVFYIILKGKPSVCEISLVRGIFTMTLTFELKGHILFWSVIMLAFIPNLLPMTGNNMI